MAVLSGALTVITLPKVGAVLGRFCETKEFTKFVVVAGLLPDEFTGAALGVGACAALEFAAGAVLGFGA